MAAPPFIPDSAINSTNSNVSAIDPAQAKQAANRLDTAYHTVNGIKTRLEQHYHTLRQTWISPAATAFDGVFEQFDQDYNSILRALKTLHEKLHQGNITYESAAQEQQQVVNRVHNLLNNH